MSTATIDAAAFREGLVRDGFEVVERDRPPGPPGEAHAHPYDARLLILGGAFIVTRDGVAVRHGPGEICEVPAGVVHAEAVGPEGARFIAGRRHKG